MSKRISVMLAAIVLAACSSKDIGPNAPTSADRQLEAMAAEKAMCKIENQARCSHVIENRSVMSRFFAPEGLGALDDTEKLRGRRITTKYVVEAVAAINQCQKTSGESVVLLRDMEINRTKYFMKATKPVGPDSACFIALDTEAN